jgi:hypothetical protein
VVVALKKAFRLGERKGAQLCRFFDGVSYVGHVLKTFATRNRSSKAVGLGLEEFRSWRL